MPLTRTTTWRTVIALAALTACLLLGASPAAAGPTVVAEIDTSTWNRPSPDPSGIAYIRRADRFLVVDGEVDETPHWEGANAWVIDRDGNVLRSLDLTRYTTEPSDVSVFRRTVFISDDDRDVIHRIRRGPDRRLGTRDDLVRSFSTHAYGSTDPEGLVRTRRFLFIADGQESRNPAVYRVNPGRDGRFGSEDRVLRIDAGSLGLRDPEGITYARRSIYVVSRLGRNRGIVRANLRGEFLQTYDEEGTGLRRGAGIAVVPSADGSSLEAWVTDRGVDNQGDPDENDGKIFVFELTSRA
jgi:hypothetical protein